MIPLTKTLVALDLETHAKCQPEEARIVEIGMHIMYADGRPDKKWSALVDPGVPITATDAHGISDADVKDAHKFKDYAQNLTHGLTNVDYCGYNVKFDLRVLAAEMERAGVPWSYEGAHILDGLRLWQVAKPRTLADAVREFLGREPTEAHRALGDASDALDVSLAILERFPELPKDIKALHELCFPHNPNFVDAEGKVIWSAEGEAALSFGKHQRTALKDVPQGYLEWMLAGNFPPDTKTIVRGALRGQFPKRTP